MEASQNQPYLNQHGTLRLHYNLQQRFDQRLRCSWDQMEKVYNCRANLHFLIKEARNHKQVDQFCDWRRVLATDPTTV